jgi:AcrR family transcriptional regulator
MTKSIATSNLREQRRSFTKQVILEAALALVARHGLYNLSLREIARQVGYSPAALYEYFDSKEAIVQALSAEGDLLLNERLAEVPPDLPPDQRLVELGLAYIDFARTHYDHFKLMFGELPTRRTSLNDPLQKDKPFYYLAKAVKDGIDQGLFKSSPDFGSGEIAYGLWSLAHGAAALQTTKLRTLQNRFQSIDRENLSALIKGLGYKNGH